MVRSLLIYGFIALLVGAVVVLMSPKLDSGTTDVQDGVTGWNSIDTGGEGFGHFVEIDFDKDEIYVFCSHPLE